MSGIFGFTIRDGVCEQPEEILGGLEYWNRIYGRDDSDTRLFDCSGIGCHIEHFSADIPRSAPIQELTGRTAVVDALLYNRDELLPMLEPAADACISDEDLSDDERQMLAVMFGSGTYGSIQSRVRIQVGSGTREERSAYVLRRLFPPMKSMKSWFPVLTKHPVLAPGFYVFRIARVLLNGDRFRRTVSEVRTLRELKNEKENTNG